MFYNTKEPIRLFNGKIVGWIESDGEGNQQIRDFYGKILGTYDKKSNMTRDFNGMMKGSGNLLMMFLDFK